MFPLYFYSISFCLFVCLFLDMKCVCNAHRASKACIDLKIPQDLFPLPCSILPFLPHSYFS